MGVPNWPAAPLVMVGLDGATFDVLDPLMQAGELPTLAALQARAARTVLLSTLPAATLPAWTSFLTGVEPAHHGVTDLFGRAPHGGYGLVPQSGAARTWPTFLLRLSRLGRRVASVSVPGTYPPEAINGVCLAGFDAPGANLPAKNAIWPPAWRRRLKQLGGWRYSVFNEQAPAQRRQPPRLVAALLADLAAKERVILDLWQSAPWDLFFVHIQASDTAAHHLWHTFDPHSPRHQPRDAPFAAALPTIYRRIDLLLKRLFTLTPPNTRILLCSDHGFGGASTTTLYLNRWLHSRGLLHFRRTAARGLHRLTARTMQQLTAHVPAAALGTLLRALPTGLKSTLLAAWRGAPVDFAASWAFSDELDYAPSIWLNRRSQFAQGCLDDAAAGALSLRLKEELLAWRHPTLQVPLMAAVHTRADLPPGPLLHRFPDLLLEPAWLEGGYRPSCLTSPGPGPAVGTLPPAAYTAARGCGMPGVHHRHGVLLACGPGINESEWPSMPIHDAGLLAYPLCGLPIPEDLLALRPTGLHPLLQAVQALAPGPRSSSDPSPPHSTADFFAAARPYTPAQELQVVQHLKALGYVD